MFESLAPKSTGERLAGRLPELAGLAAAICAAWLLCPIPVRGSVTWLGLATLGARYVLFIALTGVAIAWLVAHDTLWRRILLLAATTVWLAPLALLLSLGSVFAAIASIAVAWQSVRIVLPPPSVDNDSIHTWAFFRTFDALDSFSRVPSLSALAAAFCAYGGVTAALLDRPFISAAALGIGAGLCARSACRFRTVLEPGTRASRLPLPGMALALACSMALTLAALVYSVLGGNGASARTRPKQQADVVTAIGGEYTGVILLTDPAPHPLFAPRPKSTQRNPYRRDESDPTSVPFTGVYWMFRWPNTQPPSNSYVARRSPLNSGFRTSDGAPLSMQARQNFGMLIDLRCCSRIELAIRSADDSATLGLVLTNTTLPGRPSLSLGLRMVSRATERRGSNPSAAVPLTVSFDIPRPPAISAFDEATIVFNPVYARASAKVEVEQFIFVPRR